MISTREETLEAVPASVRTARHLVEAETARVLDGDGLDRALLCTSEVVTNAIEHGAPPIALRIGVAADRIRVEVTDGSPLRPRVGSPGPDAVRGRGLLIVDRCADRWGVDEHQDGKSVWFELRLD